LSESEAHVWQLPAEGEAPPIEGELLLPAGQAGGLPLVLFSPDLLLPRAWAFYPFLARQCAVRHPFLLYTPSCSGFRGPGDALDAPELLARYTPGTELGDLARILAALEARTLPGADRVDPGKLFVAGHGKGGAIALLAAARRPEVRGVLCMSSVSTLLRFPPRLRSELLAQGSIEVVAPLSGQRVRLSRGLLDEVEGDPEGFSLQEAVQALRAPVVFIHGEEDLEVSVKESESLYHWSRKDRTRLVLMEKVGHAFGAEHPFKASNKELERGVELFGSCIAQTLAAGPAGEPPLSSSGPG